ncbi:methyltransferase [Amylolactobacillus amylotrophicus DSM 20534]|uniref:16S rRNA (Cytidine(1402)-2'-O)-methyltransferase n=3 Tax=Amylolactobacillus TaxID=2767876 RepID=A0A1L6XAU0_9LACO|nr:MULTISPECIES: 16S rRNA (cytidine(1402)-2'-O)-methyltransferase [Amylolactobacillus]APT18087.1 16S rRNA (cytidine(1402)-2'-O)-methyltransferase [Amylolactobacillus amylophilus DSM 20533 = JCM 1125]KRK37433.1 methyltransferase [Amylolactobacillus amylotrophicus DSM 20534]KRM42106.1 methyltransferase [Amylolactobacillus amylophilus DSM 20533 = JCM 1125]GED80553.1 ribosomal RNA small subunit methyltransferase I [Amylolactobacillus amylophilus]
MQIQSSFNDEAGKLYLVPTPIGNLKDMTLRAKETLENVDLIAAEDTRTTGKLLGLLGIETSGKLVSFHEFNAKEKAPELVTQILAGHSLAQVSDAGMPVISDPGYELVQSAIAANIAVVSLPGPAAFTTALIASGLTAQPFTYYGFLPRKKKQQTDFLTEISRQKETAIFYEAPHRIRATLANLGETVGLNRQVVVARELTKLHEEYLRGTVAELIEHFETVEPRGEMVVLMGGYVESEKPTATLAELAVVVDQLVEDGQSKKDAIGQVARHAHLSKKELYDYYHNQPRE